MAYQHQINFYHGMRVKYTGYGSLTFYGTVKFMGAGFVVDWDGGKGMTPVDQIPTGDLSEFSDLFGDHNPANIHLPKKEPQEKPCKSCSKNNDVGVSSCWWCGCDNPTE